MHSAGWQLGREFQRISLLGPGILDIALSVMVFNVKFIQSISSRRNLFLANNTGFQNFVFVGFNFFSGSRVRVPPLSCFEKSVACKLWHLYCEKVEQVLTINFYAFIYYILPYLIIYHIRASQLADSLILILRFCCQLKQFRSGGESIEYSIYHLTSPVGFQ